MALYLRLPATAGFNIDNELIIINAFNANEPAQSLHGKDVNIIASGPSIQQLPLAELLDTPAIFVNGSISLPILLVTSSVMRALSIISLRFYGSTIRVNLYMQR
ncbi:hypothetical protein [Psychrobacter sp. MES7-P7E]|uniref:hypothetical protein n=1 Tax=Psychrobacter sp. MES7-P7E TaxID=2058322 RepID=UPI001D17CC05|nr:hypothetical protein [Psychrobacter sp. MES7-P7E]